MWNKYKFVNAIFPHKKNRFEVCFVFLIIKLSFEKVLRSPNVICMHLVEGKHGEEIGLFEYCRMITLFDYTVGLIGKV